MLAFIREPVPPARMRKPTLPKPVNASSLDSDDELRREVLDADWLLPVVMRCEREEVTIGDVERAWDCVDGENASVEERNANGSNAVKSFTNETIVTPRR